MPCHARNANIFNRKHAALGSLSFDDAMNKTVDLHQKCENEKHGQQNADVFPIGGAPLLLLLLIRLTSSIVCASRRRRRRVDLPAREEEGRRRQCMYRCGLQGPHRVLTAATASYAFELVKWCFRTVVDVAVAPELWTGLGGYRPSVLRIDHPTANIRQ
jgi:hypothetical protein